MRKGLKALKAAAILSGALAISVAVVPVDIAEAKKVKCYGISKAGQNDCANAAGTHSCAGHSTVDYDGGEWEAVDSAVCDEKGGKTKPFKGSNPEIS